MAIGDDDGGERGDFDPNAEGGPLRPGLRQGRFPLAGIGASAGGRDALRTLFTAMPPDTGIGFLVIQHLNAEHPSLLTELLPKYTVMPVVQAENGP
jgi:chemotaxis response regulator CheB